MAIAVIVVLATITAIALSMSAETTKRSTDLYLYEQSALYAKSAVELTLLDIAGAEPCSITEKNFTIDTIYEVNVTLKYIYTAPSPCTESEDTYFTVVTPEQNGSVLMDVTVSTTVGTEPIHYFRRSLQKL